MEIFTIGHSNHAMDEFIPLLAGHGIGRLVDVRTTPYSRFQPQFNKTALPQVLLAHGIVYTWAGDVLGGRPIDPSCYIHHAIPGKPQDYLHEVDYHEVMQRPWFVEGIQCLLKLADEKITCILCAEKDPTRCHRHHLIARYLLDSYPSITIWHILADGSLVNASSIYNLGKTTDGEQISF